MFSHRLFNIVVVLALVVVIGFTVREAAATTLVVSQKILERQRAQVCQIVPPFKLNM